MTAHRIAFRPGRNALILGMMVVRLCAQAEGTFRWPIGSTVVERGFVESSPAVRVADDGTTTIYVGVEADTRPAAGHLIALNRDGSIKWDFPTLEKANPVDSGVASSPALAADGTIYFGCQSGKFYALNPSGAKIWDGDLGAPIYSSPALGPDGTIYIVSGDFVLHALSSGGREKWRHAAGFGFDASPGLGADGTIYVGSWDGKYYALNPDGTEKWRVSTGVDNVSSPAVGADGTIYFTSFDGRLFAMAPTDGAIKWTFRADGQIAAAPVIAADNTIYFGDLKGMFYALNPDSTVKWKDARIGYAIVSTAAVGGDGTIIFGAYDGRVHALQPDGLDKWKTPATGDIILSSPVIAPDGSIYVGSEDGKVYAINGAGSPLSTFSSWSMLHHDALHSGRTRATGGGAYLINLSTRAQAGAGANLIAGFVVRGSAAKKFLLRAVGPSLAPFNVPLTLTDPAIELKSLGAPIAANDNWSSTAENFFAVREALTRVGTFELQSGGKDAALVATLPPTDYTAIVTAADGGTGVALVEVYDAEVAAGGARLINLSTRAPAGNGANVLTAGLVIGGGGPLRVLVRAIGPGLLQFGVQFSVAALHRASLRWQHETQAIAR